MFLKSLTLRGFKSFADKTTLQLEPGVTVVVGPNGAGKSNLVDAVAWVLGAQGPRTLRGGKMDDVIFAGTADRPPLGRAEVSITIDNATGLLPIEFSEVTITRTLFRTGDSEYQINGAPCRLLDIQELLSDTGIGRQQHVIVGQGQLDTVLNARPEDRRAIIEEAAGVLKYRKRKERAERRLEATEGNLLRLQDLLREVRRQLTPLQRQADAARRHDGLVDELRAIRLHLVGHEIAGLQARIERLGDTRAGRAAAEKELQARLRDLDGRVADAEHALVAVGEDDLAEALARSESLRERARGLHALVLEKQRGVQRELASVADEGVVETLVADAVALRGELGGVDAEAAGLVPLAREVEEAEARVTAMRRAREREDGGAGAAEEAAVARREAAARREAVARGGAEIARLEARLATSRERAVRLAREHDEAVTERAGAEAEGPALEEASVAARDAAVAAAEALRDAEERARRAEGEAGRWRARAEALGLALESARAAAGAEQVSGLPGVAGPLVDHLEIEPGAEAAVASALGDAMRAVVVAGGEGARVALERLKGGDVEALLLVVDGLAEAAQGELAPPGARPLATCVSARLPGLDAALARLLAATVLVDGDWRAALDLALANPGLVAVTRQGDRFGGGVLWRTGGEGAAGVTQAALDEAVELAGRAEAASRESQARVEELRAVLVGARDAEAVAEEQRRATEDRGRAAARVLERLEVERREQALDEEQLLGDLEGLSDRQRADQERLAELEGRLPGLEAAEAAEARLEEARREAEAELARHEDAAATLRRELEVRAAAIEERRAVLARRLGEVEERLARDPDAQAEAERHRSRLVARADAYDQVARALHERLVTIDALHDRLRERRRRQSEAVREAGEQLDGFRAERAGLEQELVALREHAGRAEVEEAEARLRLDGAVERLRTEFDAEPAAALDAPAPEVPAGTTLAGRARELDRELRLLGPVNPLALEEYEALQERHRFLEAQLDDVKSSRRELHRVIKAVDREIVAVFEAAFADVSAHFSDLFATLFPGGAGRLTLTDPEDLLGTGIEIEARPSGKNVRRLSLLSGGERSLTALAYLFAVFRARPSPFYLLDEVEAALDDVNLHRFLDLVHEFRGEAQLLVVSHQKRTMEAADCLYGVSMPPGGSSRVVSQRLREEREEEDVLVLP